MYRIKAVVADAHIDQDITEDEARDIAMNFVRDTYGAPDAPTDFTFAETLAKRAELIKIILLHACSRLMQGHRTTDDLCEELSPRESDVCRLIARGEIDVYRSEVQ